MLADPLAIDETIEGIRRELRNPEFLFRRNLSRVAESLEKNGDAYFSERAADIRDVKRRVLRRLTDAPPLRALPGDECGIVVDGLGTDNQGYCLADRSGVMSPRDWARAANGRAIRAAATREAVIWAARIIGRILVRV